MFQTAFFSAEFIINHPQYYEHVLQLKQCIVDQVRILELGLKLHGNLAPTEVQPLHKRLVECLAQMKHRIKDWDFPCTPMTATLTPQQHRRCDSDVGVEYQKSSIINSALPAIPGSAKAHQRSLTLSGGCGTPRSNRSSGSGSSLYGQLVLGDNISDDEEGLYCKPSEILEKLQSTPSTASTVSLASNQLTPLGRNSRSKSPRWANDYILFTPGSLRDSGFSTDRESLVLQQRTSSGAAPAPPPLPPRSVRSLQDESFLFESSTPPPIHPKRTSLKNSPSKMIQSPDMVDGGRHYRPPPGPPLPPKSTPLSPALTPASTPVPTPAPTPAPTPVPMPAPILAPAPVLTPVPNFAPPVPPHRVVPSSASFSNPLELSGGSLVDEVCSLLAASGCQMMSNGKSPSPPTSPPPPPPDENLYSET